VSSDQPARASGVNPKKSSGFFTVEKRPKLIEGSLEHMEWFGRGRSASHIGEFTGLLVD
jgi:pantetheine-phosphate adenylyltransferase